MNNSKPRVGSAFLWDFGGKLARNGVSFLVTIILARLIAPSEFGLIAVDVIFTSLSKVFSDMGLSGAIIQRKRVLPIQLHSVFYFNFFISFLLSLTMFLGVKLLNLFFQGLMERLFQLLTLGQ